MSERETWFRYQDGWNDHDGPVLFTFCVKRHTPKCVILDEWGRERQVLKEARRRFAYPAKELALESFIIRKQRQMQHCTRIHDAAAAQLRRAEAIRDGKLSPSPENDLHVDFGGFPWSAA